MQYQDAMLRCPEGHKTFTTVSINAQGRVEIDVDLQVCDECGQLNAHIPVVEITDPGDLIQIADNALESSNHSISASDAWSAIKDATLRHGLTDEQKAGIARGLHNFFTKL